MTEHQVARTRYGRVALLMTAAVALILTLTGVSQPRAGATPNTQTKFYDVYLTGSPVGANVPSTVTVQLKNDVTSTQPFGSAEVNFGNLPPSALTGVTATPDNGGANWTATQKGTNPLVWLFTSQSSVAVAPTSSLNVTFTISAPTAGSITLGTVVKQSNNFSGGGNNFINLTGDPSISVYQTCSGDCTLTATSLLTGTKGTADINGPSTPYVASAAFGVMKDLTCDSEVTTTAGDPFVVATPGTPASGTVSMTFPKSVVNNLAENGTPLMQVCAGASYAFPTPNGGTAGWVAADGLYEGLLPNCPSDYTTTGQELCVVSRSKHAANETIVIYVSDFSDPSFW